METLMTRHDLSFARRMRAPTEHVQCGYMMPHYMMPHADTATICAYWLRVLRSRNVDAHPHRLSALERRFQFWVLRQMRDNLPPVARGRMDWYDWHVDNSTPEGPDNESA